MSRKAHEQEQARKVKARFRMLPHALKISHHVSQTCRFFGVSRAHAFCAFFSSWTNPTLAHRFDGVPFEKLRVNSASGVSHYMEVAP